MPDAQEIEIAYLREERRFDNVNDTTIIGLAAPTDGGCAIEIKGQVNETDYFVPRLTYRLFGKWTSYTNRHSGVTKQQFAFSTFVRIEPLTEKGIVAYLKLCPRIGAGIAAMLYSEYGQDAVKQLRERPAETAATIPRLSVEAAQAAAEHLTEESAVESCTVELLALLAGRGGPIGTAKAAIRKLGNKAPRLIASDPFVLLPFRGWGFPRCDAMYLDLGGDPHAVRRQSLCVWYAVTSDRGGHTWVNSTVAQTALRENIGGTAVRYKEALQKAVDDRRLDIRWTDPDSDASVTDGEQEWLSEMPHSQSEVRLATRVSDLFADNQTWGLDYYPFASLSAHQVDIASQITNHRLSILGGSPGTGKTHTAAGLIQALCSKYGSKRVAVCAPTGKAAVRISEAMADRRIPLTATTIHSLLESRYSEETGWKFGRDSRRPLDVLSIVCDEGSMVGTRMMANLTDAMSMHVGARARLLLVADIHQLPPVEHGAPIRDMIAAGVPYGELTEIHRNSGRIVEACKAIREGRVFEVSPPDSPHPLSVDGDVYENLRMCECDNPLQWPTIRKELDCAKRYGLDPIWDTQVLVALNTHGPLSRRALNGRMQDYLNPEGYTVKGSPFRVGDKVINTRNAIATGPGDGGKKVQVYVANGDMAEVVLVEPKFFDAALPGGAIIRVPRGTPSNDAADDEMNTGCSWDLAYAISTHKSQGSEWPFVIIGLDSSSAAEFVCCREWIYTALSRPQRACSLVGHKAVADSYCRRQAIGQRKTFLESMLILEGVGCKPTHQ